MPATSGRSRAWRAALGAVLAVSFSFVGATSARAAEVPTCEGFEPASPCELDNTVAQWNWFWSSNVKATGCVPPPEELPAEVTDRTPGLCGPASITEGVFGNAAGQLNPISPGHFGVAMKAGDPDMRGYVKFDMGAVPLGAEITSFIATFTVSHPTQDHIDRHLRVSDSADEGRVQNPYRIPATLGDQGAKIIACAVTEPWAGTTLEGGSPPSVVRIDQDKVDPEDPDPNDAITVIGVEPASDCGTQVTGQRANDGLTWRFDLTPIAQRWASGDLFNEGIALMPSTDSLLDTWTIEFHGPELTVKPTVSSLPLPALPPEVPDVLSDGVDEATGTIFGLTESERDVVHINEAEAMSAVVAFTGGLPPVPPPPAPVAPPAPPAPPPPALDIPFDEAPPVEAPPPDTGGTVQTASADTSFAWGIIPLILLGVGLLASALGAAPATATVTAGNRVASVLHGRRVSGLGVGGGS